MESVDQFCDNPKMTLWKYGH